MYINAPRLQRNVPSSARTSQWPEQHSPLLSQISATLKQSGRMPASRASNPRFTASSRGEWCRARSCSVSPGTHPSRSPS